MRRITTGLRIIAAPRTSHRIPRPRGHDAAHKLIPAPPDFPVIPLHPPHTGARTNESEIGRVTVVPFEDHAGPQHPSRVKAWLAKWRPTPLWPLLLPATLILVAVVGVMVRALLRPQPDNPWESAQVVEGWRAMHGMPVYESWQTGHPTHMYGALAPYVLGALYHIAGPEIWVGRALALLASLATVALLGQIVLRGTRPPLWLTLFVAALIAGVDIRSGNYFVQNRPDMPALFVGLLALTAFFRGYRSERIALYALGAVLLVVGFFFKQTVAGFALIPLVAILLEEGTQGRRLWWVLAVFPFALMVAVVGLLPRVAPNVYFYMVTMPRQSHISRAAFVDGLAMIVTSFPIFVLCLGRLIVGAGTWREILFARGRLWLWTLAAVATQVPMSVLALAKAGGTVNSLLPGMLAIVAFCALMLREWLPTLFSTEESHGSQLRSAAVFGTLLLLTYPGLFSSIGYSPRWPDYSEVKAYVAQLRGHDVIAPEDGTITTAALGVAKPSIYLQYDAAGWTDTMPDFVKRELRTTEYVVDVKDWYHDLVNRDRLRQLGFEPIREFPHYVVWRQSQPAPR